MKTAEEVTKQQSLIDWKRKHKLRLSDDREPCVKCGYPQIHYSGKCLACRNAEKKTNNRSF